MKDRLFFATNPDPLYFPATGPFRRIFFRRIPTDAFARSILWPEHPEHGVGIPCARCGARGTVRMKPRIYWCQAQGCGAWSLIIIGKKLAGDGFKTIEYQPEEGDDFALMARLAEL